MVRIDQYFIIIIITFFCNQLFLDQIWNVSLLLPAALDDNNSSFNCTNIFSSIKMLI